MSNTARLPERSALSSVASISPRVSPAPVVYATYFDARFLTRGIALLRSLERHHPEAQRWVLCIDDLTHAALTALQLPNTVLVPLRDLEESDPELLRVKPRRPGIDYLFTLTAPFLHWVYAHTRARYVAYVDADVCFFHDPLPLIQELGNHPIGVTDHRYPPAFRGHYRFGVFNVGVILFQRSAAAGACLAWWRERCLEWCHDRLEGDRYGDQKYLERWPALFPDVTVLAHPGSGLATWNAMSNTFVVRSGELWVNDHPLINFHFSKFKVINRWLYDAGTRWYGYAPPQPLRQHLYIPYAHALEQARGDCLAALRARRDNQDSRAIEALMATPTDIRGCLAAVARGSTILTYPSPAPMGHAPAPAEPSRQHAGIVQHRAS